MPSLFQEYAFNKTLEEAYYQFEELGIDPKEGFKDYCYVVKKLNEQGIPYDSVLTEQVILELDNSGQNPGFFGRMRQKIFGGGNNVSPTPQPTQPTQPDDEVQFGGNRQDHGLDRGKLYNKLNNIANSLKSAKEQFDQLQGMHSNAFNPESDAHLQAFRKALNSWVSGFQRRAEMVNNQEGNNVALHGLTFKTRPGKGVEPYNVTPQPAPAPAPAPAPTPTPTPAPADTNQPTNNGNDDPRNPNYLKNREEEARNKATQERRAKLAAAYGFNPK